MLRITIQLDYAVRALVVLAARPGQVLKAREIGEVEDIPARFLGATLTELCRSGILGSRRGGDGGYWLARPPAAVSLADIVRSLDGELVDVRALTGERSATRWLWARFEADVERSASSITLADVLHLDGRSADVTLTGGGEPGHAST